MRKESDQRSIRHGSFGVVRCCIFSSALRCSCPDLPSPGAPCAQVVNFMNRERQEGREASTPGLSRSALLGQRRQGSESGSGNVGMCFLFLKQICISSVTLAFAAL